MKKIKQGIGIDRGWQGLAGDAIRKKNGTK